MMSDGLIYAVSKIAFPWLFPILPILFMAYLPTRQSRSLKRFSFAVLVVSLGVMWPICVFLVSAFYAPQWTGDARYGWIDSLHSGKIALLPLFMWAALSLYIYELWPDPKTRRTWTTLGMITGAIISFAFIAHFLIVEGWKYNKQELLLNAYIPVWFCWRSYELIRASRFRLRVYFATALGMLPFWLYSIELARRAHERLPTTPPDCFIVTAAARGHRCVTGSYYSPERARPRLVTDQLHTFWRFELLWQRSWPGGHRWFRRIYNVWGYRAARMIRTPWHADAVYLLLKPAEFLARLLLWQNKRTSRCSRAKGDLKNGRAGATP